MPAGRKGGRGAAIALKNRLRDGQIIDVLLGFIDLQFNNINPSNSYKSCKCSRRVETANILSCPVEELRREPADTKSQAFHDSLEW